MFADSYFVGLAYNSKQRKVSHKYKLTGGGGGGGGEGSYIARGEM